MAHGHTRRRPRAFFVRARSSVRGATHDPVVRIWDALWPALSIALLAPIAVMPTGVTATSVHVGCHLPLLAAVYWAIAGRTTTARVMAFASGIMIDAASAGPLGFWALANLAAVEGAVVLAETARASRLAHAVVVIACLAGSVMAEWVVIAAATRAWPQTITLAEGAARAALLYPLLAWGLHMLSPRAASSRVEPVRGSP